MEENHSLKRFQRVILIQGTVTLLVFAMATIAVLLFLRNTIRQQILHRDGVLLTNVANYLHEQASESDPEFALIDVVLESSKIQNVIAVGLYDSAGENMASIPSELYNSSLAQSVVGNLKQNKPVFSFYPDMQMQTLFMDVDALLDTQSYPVTEVLAPVTDSSGELVAIIQYWIDSEAVAHELHHMDQNLIILGAAFLIGGGIIFFLVFYISRNRLLKMGRILAEQNRSLQKANADLAMAARTSAIGSITSHLFHGLKNPLAGLKAYLQLAGHDEEVLEITSRMQKLIDESLSVIRDEEGFLDQELSMKEFVQLSENRMRTHDSNIVRITASGDGCIAAHKAQLLLLVMRNLLDNAVEASPGSPVDIEITVSDNVLNVTVEDKGPGLPQHVKEHLFDPVQSTKENGTGIGLAISSVIARHIPSTLQLRKSDRTGTTFSIEMPL